MGRSKQLFTQVRHDYINPLYDEMIQREMRPVKKSKVKSKNKVTPHPSRDA